MALKRKLTKAEWDKLKPDLQFEYEADGDNYSLKLDGEEDTGALKRARDREKQLRIEAEAALESATTELDQLKTSRTSKEKDIDRLTAAHERKLGETKAEYDTRIGKLTGQLSKILVDGVASTLAGKLSNAPAVLKPHLMTRLAPDFSGDEPATIVLDAVGKPAKHADGKPWTVDDLAKEFVANKEFAAIMIASKASGGGAPQRQTTLPAASGPHSQQTVPLARQTPADLAAKITADKAAKAGAQ